jgi:hypothetical protein
MGALFALPVAPRALASSSSSSSIIALVVSRSDPPARQYRALRRLEARSAKLSAAAWMEAWTEVDPQDGFRYRIIGEGGSGYIRSHVLKPWLENERKMWAAGDPERASLSLANYTFEDRGITDDGSIFVNPDNGDLVRIEGRLSKTPSFWTRRVEVVRHYQRINGVHLPVAIESVAQVLIAGRSTFSMSYEYETVNNIRVGDPKPRAVGDR